jgi:hypothetical protein
MSACWKRAAPTLILALSTAASAQGSAAADELDDERPAAQALASWHGLVELKRQASYRGTPGETTKTNLKFDYFPRESTVSLLRLELPFPDEKTTFKGSAFDPDFGDAKIRVGFRAFDVSGPPAISFVELTFPTANPESQGTGKYQVSGGLRTAFQMPAGAEWLGSPRQFFSVQVQQVVSFGGDPTRSDINQTKFELEWRNVWGHGHYAKATAKPVIDWVGHGQTGAVLDFEGGWWLDPQWTLAIMAGGLLWGKGVPSTYERRVEIKVVHRY